MRVNLNSMDGIVQKNHNVIVAGQGMSSRVSCVFTQTTRCDLPFHFSLVSCRGLGKVLSKVGGGLLLVATWTVPWTPYWAAMKEGEGDQGASQLAI